MKHPFKKLNNESGIVLFIVLMTIIIITIFTVSILPQSINEMNFDQQQVDQVRADQLAKGMWWYDYSNSEGPAAAPATNYNMNGRIYTAIVNQEAGGQYMMTVNYTNN